VPADAAPGTDVASLSIVAVGSVWLSFPLFRDEFVAAATAPFPTGGLLLSFRLLRLTETSALGAAWKGARDAGRDLPLNFAANVETLFEYTGSA
jgi:hypothetical protein